MLNNSVIKSLIILVLIILLVAIFKSQKRKKILNLIENKKTETLLLELEKATTRMCIPAYFRENLKLNAYLIQNDKNNINQQFEKMWGLHKNNSNNKEFLTKMLNHYIYVKDKNRAKKILNEIKLTVKEESVIVESEMVYKIFVEKSAEYIEVLTKKFDFMNISQKALAAYYISEQYKNINQFDKAKKFEELYKQLID